MALLVRIIVIAFSLWVATLIVPGIEITAGTTTAGLGTLIGVALIFGLVNAVIKPIIKTVGCAFYIITLGLISLIVNALLFLLVGWIADRVGLSFTISGFWAAFWGAIVVAVVSWILHVIIPDSIDER
jgi:putative membrane protein